MRLSIYRIKDFAVKAEGCPRSVSTLPLWPAKVALLPTALAGFFIGDKNEFNSS